MSAKVQTMSDKPVIEERENGPLVAKGITRMTGRDGSALDCKPVMALCRCGGSSNKPFCDGTHNTNGFQSRGGDPSGKDKIYRFAGASLTVLYNPRVCSHAAECIRLSRAFDSAKRPWIEPDKDTPARIEEAVRACPSGALRIDGQDHLLPDRPEIVVQKNGPYWILGADIAEVLPGEGATPDKKVLCRCGLSGNKPYCDGSHHDARWRDGQD